MLKKLLSFFIGGGEASNGTSASCPVKTVSGGTGSQDDLVRFVEYVAKALVDNPGAVRVTEENGADSCMIKISCDKSDIGKIVGRHGKTIMAIRSLVSGAAGRLQKRVSVEVVD